MARSVRHVRVPRWSVPAVLAAALGGTGLLLVHAFAPPPARFTPPPAPLPAGTYPAAPLAAGSELPPIQAGGWVNGAPPERSHAKLLVLDIWAKW
jgi:hypothetical protein